MDGKRRADIRPGQQVEIVLKKDQPTGRRTRGVVRAHPDKQPHPPPRHQGDAGGRAGRPRTGCAGRAGSAMKKPQPFGWGFRLSKKAKK